MTLIKTFSVIFVIVVMGLQCPKSVSADEKPDDQAICIPYASIELCHSTPQVGDYWIQDFDAGWFRSGGVEAGFDGAISLRKNKWRANIHWRGRWGEMLPARGLLRSAWLSYRWSFAELRVGRGHFVWTPTEEMALLFSQNARPIDHVSFRLIDLPLLKGAGTISAENFIGYLDDPHRVIPNPLMWGMRLVWAPRDWLALEAQRSIMFGGSDRGGKLTAGDLWGIFIGRGEGEIGGGEDGQQYHHADTNQLFAWQVRMHPRSWARRRLGVDDLEICFTYAGEDRFERYVPMAAGRVYAIRLHPSRWLAFSYIDLGNRDDKNHWYWHKIYWSGYTYRGVIIGAPMGGEARSWRAAIFLTRPGSGGICFARLIRESHRLYWDPVQTTWTKRTGGFRRFELGASVPMGSMRPYVVMGMAKAWDGDRKLERLADSFVRFGVEITGSRLSGKLDATTVWGLWP